jgi:arylsulfatase A-like enzyme
VPAGRTVEEVVELVDVHPTLLELLGLPPAPDCQGQSLVPLLQGTAAGDGLAFSMLPTEYAGQEDAGGGKEPPALAVRSGRWKLVLRGPGEVRLYDLSADPEEREDRAAREPRVVATLRPKLEEWLREVRRDGSGQGPLGAAAEEFLRGLGYTVGTEDGGQ